MDNGTTARGQDLLYKAAMRGHDVQEQGDLIKGESDMATQRVAMQKEHAAQNLALMKEESAEADKLRSAMITNINNFVNNFKPEDQEEAQNFMANGLNSGQLSMLDLADPRTAIPLMRTAYRDSKMAAANSDNIFSTRLNKYAPTNYVYGGRPMGSTFNETDEQTEKRLREQALASQKNKGGLVNG